MYVISLNELKQRFAFKVRLKEGLIQDQLEEPAHVLASHNLHNFPVEVGHASRIIQLHATFHPAFSRL